jgi:ABC-type phosphate transport system substrate-binding protein
LLPRFGFQTSEGTLSLAAEEAQPPPDGRPDRSPLAVAALVLGAVLGLAACTGWAASTSVSPVQVLPTTPASAAQRLSETGSSLVAPLFTLWGPAYHAQFSQVRDLRAFLNWAISTGTAQLAQVNFQPLPPSVVTLSQAQIAKIKG